MDLKFQKKGMTLVDHRDFFLGHCPIDFIMGILLLHTTRQHRVS